MKQLVTFDPTFTPGLSGVGTLDFSGYAGFQLDHLYAVVNTTRGTPIYVPGTTQFGISSSTPTKITLLANTSTHNSNDTLLTYYDTIPGYESNFAVEFGGQLQKLQETTDQLLGELRIHTFILEEGFNVGAGDVIALRNDLDNPEQGAL
jgi:hypothetical protein